ncbi:hypothetical protein [Acinetobacter baumannii]|uniref:hypothetical protein n=1 Tax=Acinetobacter baumannii TaxID=470 RepID=UPI00294A7B5C|nr:hypothetical protein [Acinetobacter baumannii]MDV5263223.1 hypothetical protein [Acinetobacter baumannii]
MYLYNSFAELQSFYALQRVMMKIKIYGLRAIPKVMRRHFTPFSEIWMLKALRLSEMKTLKRTAEFLAILNESLKYQVVISTSAIASGVSIQHEQFIHDNGKGYFDCVVGFLSVEYSTD